MTSRSCSRSPTRCRGAGDRIRDAGHGVKYVPARAAYGWRRSPWLPRPPPRCCSRHRGTGAAGRRSSRRRARPLATARSSTSSFGTRSASGSSSRPATPLRSTGTPRSGTTRSVTSTEASRGSTATSSSRPRGRAIFPASRSCSRALYRKALEEGKLHQIGETVVRGRRAILVEAAQPHGGAIVRAALDAETFRLLRILAVLRGRPPGNADRRAPVRDRQPGGRRTSRLRSLARALIHRAPSRRAAPATSARSRSARPAPCSAPLLSGPGP